MDPYNSVEVFANFNGNQGDEEIHLDAAFESLLEQRNKPLKHGDLEDISDDEKLCNTNLHTAHLFKTLSEKYKKNSSKVQEYSDLLKELNDLTYKIDSSSKRLRVISVANSIEVTSDLDETYTKYRRSIMETYDIMKEKIEQDRLKLETETDNISRKLNSLRSLIITGVGEIVKPDDQQKKMCAVCFEHEVNMALVPCGHTYCKSCCEMNRTTGAKCPQCRSVINARVKIFFSI